MLPFVLLVVLLFGRLLKDTNGQLELLAALVEAMVPYVQVRVEAHDSAKDQQLAKAS